jgi:hypothetical protein
MTRFTSGFLAPAVLILAAAAAGQVIPPATPRANPYTPPACVPGVPFADVTCTTGFDPWIEQFGADGITAGCGGGNYCPGSPVTRDQMAVFIEKAMRGTPIWTPGEMGYFSTALGYQALVISDPTALENTAVGAGSLSSNTTGQFNTAVGANAGVNNATGSLNTFVGNLANAASSNLQNATAIGSEATVDASDKVRIGDTSVTVIEGQVAWSWPSDMRLKENIRDLDLGLDFLMQLRPVSFTMKQGNGRTDMGFLAQEVEALLGDGYNVLGIGADKDRTLSMRGTDLIAPLVKAVQEQQAQIEAQRSEIESLKNAAVERDRAWERRLAAVEQRRP